MIPAQRSVVGLQGIQVWHGKGVMIEDAKGRPSEAGGTALACPGSSAPAGDVRLHYAQIMMSSVDLLLGVVIRGGSVAGAATSRRRRGSGIAAS